jgi:uncharacterized protein
MRGPVRWPAMVRVPVIVAMWIVLMVGGCAGPTCARTYVPSGPRQVFLWDVRGANGSLTLFGTWHGAGERDVPAEAWRRLEGAEVFVAEVEVGVSRAGSIELPPGQSLAKMIPEGDFYDLVDLLGMSGERVVRLKPWAAMSMLTARAWPGPSPAMDVSLLARARARGRSVRWLETWDEQLASLDAGVGGADLSQAIHEYASMRCTLEDTYAAYRAGDDARLGGALVGEAREQLLRRRNARWLPQLEELMRSGRAAFVAVGVGHLVGEDGLVAQLAARGYEVRRVGR